MERIRHPTKYTGYSLKFSSLLEMICPVDDNETRKPSDLGAGEVHENPVRAAFEYIDRDGNSGIDAAELQDYFDAAGVDATERDQFLRVLGPPEEGLFSM